jgi:hypothetical protein
MQRRKFMVGLGSLAAGGAAAMGTGAFAVTRVNRDITVSTTADDSAYLGLVPDSEYATLSGSKLALNFNELNKDADTSFRNVFYIKNNGTNSIRVQLTDGTNAIDFANDSPMMVSYSDTRDDGTAYSNLTAFPNSPNWIGDLGYGHAGPDSADANSGFLDLSPGEYAFVHIDFFLRDDNPNSKKNANVTEAVNPKDISSVPDEIGFYASALPQSGSL